MPANRSGPGRSWQDRYLLVLCLILGGYAFFGKGFASLGVAPLFLGEAALACGLAVIFTNGNYQALFSTAPALLLVALFGWVAIRVTPGVQLFGVVALRDAVVVGYGLFALGVVSLLVDRPERLAAIIRAYRPFAGLYGLVAAPLFYLDGQFGNYLPVWPGSQIPLIIVRPGEIAVHLTGVAVFALAGFRRASPLWIIMVLLGIGVISPSRGATLACVIPLVAGVVLTRNLSRFAPYLLAGACLFALAYTLDIGITLEGGRSMGPRQIVSNFNSLTGTTGEANMDNTKAWRLAWWQSIENYTFNGPYFWTGKGFGESLAEIDGFVVGEETGGPPLRSPHNGHLTMLARAGVPGLVLWVSTWLGWFAVMLHGLFTARCRNEPGWAGLFVWVGCYVAAILIDASFDVALEGPMLGVWFWCLFGLGIASAMIYRARIGAAHSFYLRTRSIQLRDASVPSGPVPSGPVPSGPVPSGSVSSGSVSSGSVAVRA